VGVRELREYASLLLRDGIDRVVVVTTSTFTHTARAEAKGLGVELVDGRALSKLLRQHGVRPPATADSRGPSKLGTTASSNPGCLISLGLCVALLAAFTAFETDLFIVWFLAGLGVAAWGLVQLVGRNGD